MAKLTDKQHKKMIARYAECQNYSQVAREFNVGESTVRRHIAKDPKAAKKAEQKKEENTLDMLTYLDRKKSTAQDFVDMAFEYMQDPKKMERASLQTLATAIGIVIDKFTQNVPLQTQGNNALLQEIRDGIREGRDYVE